MAKKRANQSSKRQAVGNKPPSTSQTMTIAQAVQWGVQFFQNGQLPETETVCRQILQAQPNNSDALALLAGALQQQSKTLEAIHYYQQAIAINPTDPNIYLVLGHAQSEAGQMVEAMNNYRNAFQIRPSPALHSFILLGLHYIIKDPETLFYEHQQFNARYAAPLAVLNSSFLNDRTMNRRLRIGYVSQDFRQHGVSCFLRSFLTRHDRSQFEIFCYYNNFKGIDETTHFFQNYADHWLNCYDLSDEALTAQIKQDQIDILIDLMGHTGYNRILVFARKPAPIQVTYLGYSDTTGLTAMDYHLTDNYADPAGIAEPFNAEKLIHLPNSYFCYQPRDDAPPVNALPACQNGYITFGSLNTFFKLQPEILGIWAQILERLPTAKLFVKITRFSKKRDNLNGTENRQIIADYFARAGLPPERLILKSYVPTAEYFQLYHQVDIALDSFPYNGATTTHDTLWMGVPVVTLVGKTHVSRMGYSILSALGLTEFIAQSPEEYIDICVRLANDLAQLQTLRQNLRARLQASSLLDALQFTKHLEEIYRQLWKDWLVQQ